jgi:gliding motility-associated-like protein/uncharacterized repeat protein (TIGR01451 family)
MNSFSNSLPEGCKHLLTLLLTLWSLSGFAQLYHDVSIRQFASAPSAIPGASVTFTITVSNQGQSNLTGLSVKNTLPAGAQYLGHVAPPGTTFNPGTGVWNIANFMTQAVQSLNLTIDVTLSNEGIAYNLAEVLTLNEMDVDSKPGNTSYFEDDLAGTCVSVPYKICPAQGDSVKMVAPDGLIGYAWYRNGTELLSNAQVCFATEPGSYTFSANMGVCAAGGCCPVVVESACAGVFDLSLTKTLASGQPNPVNIGDEIRYLITVYNEGDVAASNIEITDRLPTGVTLSPNNPGWFASGPGEAIFKVPITLQPGDSFAIEIVTVVNFGGSGQQIVNEAEITDATDEDGNIILDDDSTPNNQSSDEDDFDGQGIELLPHDPTGYIYCDKTGMIITGGTVSVTGPGQVFIMADGSNGYYEFYTDGTPGTYHLAYTHPDGYPLSLDCLPQPGALDPTGLPNPYFLGSDSLGLYLADSSCAANPYYLSFEIEPGDPIIFFNNLPVRCSYVGSTVCLDADGNDQHDGTEPGLGDITVKLFHCADTLNPIMTTITDLHGNYSFNGLPSGNYMVQFVLPAGYRFIQNHGLSADGFSACISLDDGACDTTTSVCMYACPLLNAGQDVEICNGASTPLVANLPYGSGNYIWTPAAGLNNSAIFNPIANPSTTTVYTVYYEDGLGCSAIDSVKVTVGDACQGGGDLVVEDTVTINTNCAFSDPLFCFNIPYVQLSNYSFELNGNPYDATFGECDYLIGRYYTYASLLGIGSTGPYRLEAWSVAGTMHSAEFQTMDELAQLMSQWDPYGNWTNDLVARSIIGGDKLTNYSQLIIRHLTTGAVAQLFLYELHAPNSSYVILPEGANVLVIKRLTDHVTDTVHLRAACLTPDTVELVMMAGQTDTLCLSTAELQGPVVGIFNVCPPGFNQAVDFSVVQGTNCVAAHAQFDGLASACYVICDEFGVCDTTYFNVMVNSDEMVLHPDSLCTPFDQPIIGEVLINDNIPHEVVSVSILTPPLHGSVVVNADNTVTYQPAPGYCNPGKNEPLDEFSYEVCTEFDCQSTTVFVKVQCDGIVVYNGFSPNGDGTNETFKIDGLSAYPEHNIMIFNRWGNKVFESGNYRNDWDGKWNDKLLPYGTYFYLIFLEKGKKPLSGYVQIFR